MNYPVLNLAHLEERMRQSGDYTDIVRLSKTRLMEYIDKAIVDVDMDQARKEVAPFVPDPKVLDIWDKEFFRASAERIILE